MSNIADLIEEYILRRLAAQQNGKVELRRTDIADEISCAPSQISYVLSTRFTPEKGYLVESRRGSGGFIRIVRILPVEEQEEEPEVEEILRYWHKNHMLTAREYTLLQYFMSIMDLDEEEKRQILRQAVRNMIHVG